MEYSRQESTRLRTTGAVKKLVKAVMGLLAFGLGRHKRLLRGHAVIVAFHRVSDGLDNSSINCSPRVFEALCRFFRRHFQVVSLADLIDRIRRNDDISGLLVITFDDGYKDNYSVAAPILERWGLPATIFIATEFIGSRTQAFWDRNDGVPSEWMNWDEVVSLKDRGFDIGGHSMNHVDLAAADATSATREIAGCRQKLTEKLGVSVSHFAYPFGGRNHVSPAVIEMVTSAGFDCCVSCHGGIVSSGDGPFDLKREPINSWVSSPYQYGFELLRKIVETNR